MKSLRISGTDNAWLVEKIGSCEAGVISPVKKRQTVNRSRAAPTCALLVLPSWMIEHPRNDLGTGH
jgi:hypothetical protein